MEKKGKKMEDERRE